MQTSAEVFTLFLALGGAFTVSAGALMVRRSWRELQSALIVWAVSQATTERVREALRMSREGQHVSAELHLDVALRQARSVTEACIADLDGVNAVEQFVLESVAATREAAQMHRATLTEILSTLEKDRARFAKKHKISIDDVQIDLSSLRVESLGDTPEH